MNNSLLYRKYAGYTQKEVAQALDISEGTYRRKEKGLSRFKDYEMEIFLEMIIKKGVPASIQDIFFTSLPTKNRRMEVKRNA